MPLYPQINSTFPTSPICPHQQTGPVALTPFSLHLHPATGVFPSPQQLSLPRQDILNISINISIRVYWGLCCRHPGRLGHTEFMPPLCRVSFQSKQRPVQVLVFPIPLICPETERKRKKSPRLFSCTQQKPQKGAAKQPHLAFKCNCLPWGLWFQLGERFKSIILRSPNSIRGLTVSDLYSKSNYCFSLLFSVNHYYQNILFS